MDSARSEDRVWRRLVAEMDGGIVGHAVYGHDDTTYHPRRFYTHVGVDPDRQGWGIGKALYETVVREAEPFNLLAMESSARSEMHRSTRFLEDRGFLEVMRVWEMELDLTAFDPERFADEARRPEAAGVRIIPLREALTADSAEQRLYQMSCAIM